MSDDTTDHTKNHIKKSIDLLLESLDNTVKHSLKLILKKNQQSNIKGFQKLNELLVTLSFDDVLKLLTIWVKIYNKSISDEYGHEEKIIIQTIHLNIVKNHRTALNKHVDSIFITWLLSIFDVELEAAKIAKESFCLYFEDTNLQLDSKLNSPFAEKITEYLKGKLREVASQNLKDIKFDYKYESVLKKSIQLAFYLLANCQNFKANTSEIMEIIFEPKFLSVCSKSKEGIVLIFKFFTDILKSFRNLDKVYTNKICVNTLKLLKNTNLCADVQLAVDIMTIICDSYVDIAFDPAVIRDHWLKLPVLLLDDSSVTIRYLLPFFKLVYNFDRVISSFQFHKSVLSNLAKAAYKFQSSSKKKNSLNLSIISLMEKVIKIIFDTVDQSLVFQIFNEIGFEHLILSYKIEECSANIDVNAITSFLNLFELIYHYSERIGDDRLLLQFIKVTLARFDRIIINLATEYDDTGTLYFIAFFNALKSKPRLIDMINYQRFAKEKFESLEKRINEGNHPELLVYFCILGSYMIDFSYSDAKFEEFVPKILKNLTKISSKNMISPMAELLSRLTVNRDLLEKFCGDFDPSFMMSLAISFLNKKEYLSYSLIISQYAWARISQDNSNNLSVVDIYTNLVSSIINDCHPALMEFKHTVIQDLIQCKVQNTTIFMNFVSFFLGKTNFLKIFDGLNYQKLMEKWFFGLMKQDSFYFDFQVCNIPVVLKFFGNFVHDIFCRVIDEKKMPSIFSSFFSTKSISTYFESYENFKKFTSYLPNLSRNKNYTILSLVGDHRFLQNVSLKVPYIPIIVEEIDDKKPYYTVRKHTGYIHKEVCNELMVFYIFFNVPNSVDKLKNYITHNDFVNFILDIAYMTIFSDLEKGLIHVIFLFNKLLPEFANNIIHLLLRKCEVNAHYCVVLYYLLKYCSCPYEMQLKILKKFLLGLECNSAIQVYNLNHLGIISTLISLMKNDEKLNFLMNQCLSHPSIYEDHVLFFLMLRSFIFSYLNSYEKTNCDVNIQSGVFKKLTEKYVILFTGKCESTWITQCHTDIVQIERYLGVSLARHFIQLFNIISHPEMTKDFTLPILQAIYNDALIKSLGSSYDALTRNEIIMLCDIILYDISYPKSTFQFTHVSVPLLQSRKPSSKYPQSYVEICQKLLKLEKLHLYDKNFTESCSKEASSDDKNISQTQGAPIQSSGVVELHYYATSSSLPENSFSQFEKSPIKSSDEINSQIKEKSQCGNILLEILKLSNSADEIKVVFIDYFKTLNKLSKLKTDPIFLYEVEGTKLFEINKVLMQFMLNSIHKFSKLKSCRDYIRQDYYFTSKYVTRDIFIATTHMINFHLFIQLMKRVSDENQLIIFGSNDVKKILLCSLTEMFNKIDLGANYLSRCEAFSTLDSSFLQNFIYQTLLFFGMEYPLILNDLVRSMDNRRSKHVMDFCKKYFSRRIICSQINKCVNYFKDNKEFVVIGDYVLNKIILNSQINDEKLEFYIRFSNSYPFEHVVIEPKDDVKVCSSVITGFLKSFQIYLITHKHLSIVDGLKYFRTKLNECLNANEMCSVCFSVISPNDMSLPNKKCAICTKKFHKICLFNWFSTSTKRTCPMCRSAFF